jgi:hypothetical protein
MVQGFLRDNLEMIAITDKPDSRRFVQGILFDPVCKTMVTTDGRCMVVRPIATQDDKMEEGQENISVSIILPVDILKVIKSVKTCKDDYGQFVQIFKQDGKHFFRFWNDQLKDFQNVKFDPVEGSFPPYHKVLPDRSEQNMVIRLDFELLKRIYKSLHNANADLTSIQLEIINNQSSIVCYSDGVEWVESNDSFGIIMPMKTMDFPGGLYHELITHLQDNKAEAMK